MRDTRASAQTGAPPAPDLAAFESLVREILEAPRDVGSQVLAYIESEHLVSPDEAPGWLRAELAGLEPWQAELLLSPLFTPDHEQRAKFEPLLGESSLSSGQQVELCEMLTTRSPVRMQLDHAGERIEAPHAPVVVERFVRLLHLDAPLPVELHSIAVGRDDILEPRIRCRLRDRAWRRLEGRGFGPALIDAARRSGGELVERIDFLSGFLRSHRPHSLDECGELLENVARAYEEDLEKWTSGKRSFFNAELCATHCGSRKVDADTAARHRAAIATARALRAALGGS